MGEIADFIINGDLCQECCCPCEEDGHGYPQTCNDCKAKQMPKREKVNCPTCNKLIKKAGLDMHIRVVHG